MREALRSERGRRWRGIGGRHFATARAPSVPVPAPESVPAPVSGPGSVSGGVSGGGGGCRASSGKVRYSSLYFGRCVAFPVPWSGRKYCPPGGARQLRLLSSRPLKKPRSVRTCAYPSSDHSLLVRLGESGLACRGPHGRHAQRSLFSSSVQFGCLGCRWPCFLFDPFLRLSSCASPPSVSVAVARYAWLGREEPCSYPVVLYWKTRKLGRYSGRTLGPTLTTA